MRNESPRTLLYAGTLVTLMGVSLVTQELWLVLKAQAAGVLIRRAFAAHLEDGAPHRPWRWADMHPLARLEVPRLRVRRPILSGASGESMAFGLGHLDGTAAPNASGNCVIAGHRDAAAKFLKRLRPGDEIALRSHGATRSYRVQRTAIVSMHDATPIEVSVRPRLTLLTCYPFDGAGASNARYVVVCVLSAG